MENTNQFKQQQLISTKGKSLEDYILLDSGSTCDTMCNPKFTLEKRPAKNPCQLATNNAISVMDQESTVPGLQVYLSVDRFKDLLVMLIRLKL